ncbi:hypothetical protein NI17_016235 [Thermobifida halotolerans]|uniref:DUF4190 domain-containing protein n=2 Tax=Thermobifida halotolerans TaxID=483545 RepID=A0AA97M2W2_9ACTN|nr:hypothetical protein [Thermobifida halotolerans]UOE18370.1 hypothetical protein NI17_016235 [Thermobifida halotolerans]
MAEPYPAALSDLGQPEDTASGSSTSDYPFDLPPRAPYGGEPAGGTGRTEQDDAVEAGGDPGPGPSYDLSSRSYRPEDLYTSGTAPASPSASGGAERTTTSFVQGATYRLDTPVPEESSASGDSGYDLGLSSTFGARSAEDTAGPEAWGADTGAERGATYRLDTPVPEESSASGDSGYDLGLSSTFGARSAEDTAGPESQPEWSTDDWSPRSTDDSLTGYSAGAERSHAAPADNSGASPAERSAESVDGRTDRPLDPTSIYRIPTRDSDQSPSDPNRLVPPYHQQHGSDYPGWGTSSGVGGGLGEGAASASDLGVSDWDRGEEWESRGAADSSLGGSLGADTGWGTSSGVGGGLGEGAASASDLGVSDWDRGEEWESRGAADSSLGGSLGADTGWGTSSGVGGGLGEGAASASDLGVSDWDRGEEWESRGAADSSLGGSLGSGSGNTWAFSRDDPRLPESVREIAERAAGRPADVDTSLTASLDTELSWSPGETDQNTWDTADDDGDRWDRSGETLDAAEEEAGASEPEARHEEASPEAPASADPLLAIADEQARARTKELASQNEVDNWNLAEGIVKENTGAVPLPPELGDDALAAERYLRGETEYGDHSADHGSRYDELGYDGRRDTEYSHRGSDDYDDYDDYDYDAPDRGDRRRDHDGYDGYEDDDHRFDQAEGTQTLAAVDPETERYGSGWRGDDASHDDDRDRREEPDDDYYDDVDDRYYPEPVREGRSRTRKRDKIVEEFPGFSEPLGGTASDYPGYDNIDVWPETEGLATATLWLGIFSLIPGVGLLLAVIALVLGPKAKRNIRTSRGHLEGEQLVKAGTVLACIGIAVSVLAGGGALLLS